MNDSMSNLWSWKGTLHRGPYLLVGCIGFALKYGLDTLVANFVFQRPWSLSHYLVPFSQRTPITSLATDQALFVGTMVALALPFIWVGVAMTVRRLRDAGLPLWLVAVFFVPFVNLLLFAVLGVVPGREVASAPGGVAGIRRPSRSFLSRASGAVIVSALLGALLTKLAVSGFRDYGWGLFVGLPFVMGLVSVLLYGGGEPRECKSCLGIACLSILLYGAGLLVFAMEGLICLIMAAPIGAALASLGGLVGYAIQSARWNDDHRGAVVAVILALPLLMGAEHVTQPPSPLLRVCTAVEIDAPPGRVWQNVVAFSELPPPTEWLFRLGIAYPIRAELNGCGVGAIRHCVFSTGAFEEPIEVWDEPRLLKFSVTANPPPMEEWTPYRHVHPPHLDGFLVSRGGQFHLVPIEGDRTRLEGTTWYHHGMWPARYWQWWSDYIIHTIHLRVLTHIRHESELTDEP